MTMETNPQSPLPHAELQEGSTLYYALQPVPVLTKQKLFAVLNLCNVLSNTLNEVAEPTVAEKKIHWWHEEITRMHASEPRHPATQAVAPFLQEHAIDTASWLAILSANNDEKFINATDEAGFQTRLQKDYHTRIKLCSQLLQDHDKEPLTHWAAALGQFDRLRHFHRLHTLGYPVFPDEDYTRHALEPSDIAKPEKRAQVSALFAHRIESTIAALHLALSESDTSMQAGSLPFYTLATLRKAQLELWQQRSILPSEAYSTLTPVKKAWLAWRCRSQYRGKA